MIIQVNRTANRITTCSVKGSTLLRSPSGNDCTTITTERCLPIYLGGREVLTLGVPDENGNVILLRPIKTCRWLGGKLY